MHGGVAPARCGSDPRGSTQPGQLHPRWLFLISFLQGGLVAWMQRLHRVPCPSLSVCPWRPLTSGSLIGLRPSVPASAPDIIRVCARVDWTSLTQAHARLADSPRIRGAIATFLLAQRTPSIEPQLLAFSTALESLKADYLESVGPILPKGEKLREVVREQLKESDEPTCSRAHSRLHAAGQYGWMAAAN